MTTQRDPLDRFFSIIPAGGIGSRLWPLSRASAPKFLHDLTGSGQTLLQDTWDRLTPIAGKDRILVVTGKVHKSAVLEQIEDLSTDNLVLELSPKDSTAAIALAAAILMQREPDVIIGSFAADHVITEEDQFHKTVREAVLVAAELALESGKPSGEHVLNILARLKSPEPPALLASIGPRQTVQSLANVDRYDQLRSASLDTEQEVKP